jgi:hypothetical protein
MGRYLRGEVQPGFDLLRRISEALGDLSIDWLLFGEGGDEPRYRGDDRPRADLETAVAIHVLRAVRDRMRPAMSEAPVGFVATPPEQQVVWFADGGAILAQTIDRVVADLTTWRVRSTERFQAHNAIMGVLTRWARSTPPGATTALTVDDVHVAKAGWSAIADVLPSIPPPPVFTGQWQATRPGVRLIKGTGPADGRAIMSIDGDLLTEA